jgi:deoxyribonuclease-4
MPSYGFHASLPEGDKSIEELNAAFPSLGALQIFASNPKSFALCNWSDAKCSKIKTALLKYEIKLFIHAPYIINPSAWSPTDPSTSSRQIALLKSLLTCGERMGAKGIVIHVGKALRLGEEEGIHRMEMFCKEVLSSSTADCKLLIETCAGQGTEVAKNLKTFGTFCKKLVHLYGKKKVGVVIDTCHIFAAGYDLAKHPMEILKEIEESIGWDIVTLIHLNDSETAVGSGVDRHAMIGAGKIGKEPLQRFVSDVFKHHPRVAVVLETPVMIGSREAEMAWLHSLV